MAKKAEKAQQVKLSEHPEYAAQYSKWRTIRDLCENDHATLVGSFDYLWPNELEFSRQPVISNDPDRDASGETVGQRIRRIRATRSRNFNLMEPALSTLISMGLRHGVQCDKAVDELLGEDGKKNIDGRNTTFEDFVKGPVAVAYFRDGRPLIHVDAPENNATSRAEELAAGFRPFMEVLDVLAVKDWQLAELGPRSGTFDWLRHECRVIAPRVGPEEEPKEVTYCKAMVKTDEGVACRVYRQEEGGWILESERVLKAGFDEIPVAGVLTNESWLKDGAEQQLVVFNELSAFYNLTNTQAFQRIFIAGDMSEKHAISISEYAVSQVPLGAVVTVIPPSSTDAIESAIWSAVDMFLRVVFNRARGLAADSKEAPGENTLREMVKELVDLLKQAVGEIEAAVNQALRYYAMFKLGPEKGKAFTGKVTLSRDIEPEDVEEQLSMFIAYRAEILKILPWRKAHLKKVVSGLRYPEAELKEILKAIDDLKEEPPLDPLGGLGPFMNRGGSIAEQGNGDNEAGRTGPGGATGGRGGRRPDPAPGGRADRGGDGNRSKK